MSLLEELIRSIDEIKKAASEEIGNVASISDLEKLRVTYLGRKAELNLILRQLKELSPEERKIVGEKANAVKKELEEKIREKESQLSHTKEKKEIVDFSLPGKKYYVSSEHPIQKLINEICEFFIGLGYEVVSGPEAEIDYYNFTALNIPPYHPARSMHDTLYLSESTLFELEGTEDELREATRKIALLRTHTSPVQIRTMLRKKPPLFIVAPGRCYRRDVPDATHSPVFHQIEGLAVAEGISFSDLKGTLELFLRNLFSQNARVRFRASYFPFTEPSAEVDVSCIICGGDGCRVCKDTGWLEVLGAGMVHPNVLEEVGYDSEKYTGFAFGMGVERLAMLKYGIPDIRLFFENNLKFLEQF
ncbi:MAG: phenylalanine--tRNA ligase subunit alpha [Actinobacteria bacterium]|nr:phenylalanine--tRNA ligase subunit alpha [Actinomycetota bacterium]